MQAFNFTINGYIASSSVRSYTLFKLTSTTVLQNSKELEHHQSKLNVALTFNVPSSLRV